jgi:hypothetical protein
VITTDANEFIHPTIRGGQELITLGNKTMSCKAAITIPISDLDTLFILRALTKRSMNTIKEIVEIPPKVKE